ncbi:MAG: permease-like cell division protein FtsX [Bacilli bacterium]|nr:permease-like cell division protein FtsX [Bacilli bacterium]MDD4547701.1 permease-like cell division protein FtsX [Bacilli bacterium]
MRVFRILGRNIRDSFKSVFRNFSLSMASISSITITLLVVSISIVLSYNVNNFAVLVEKDVTIVAFIENEATDEELKQIEEQINTLQNVESYEFQSKEDITNDMIKSSDIFKNIMEGWSLDENPIQNTFLVKVTDIEKIGDTATLIGEMENVAVVKYGEGMVEQLVKVFEVVEKISLIMVASLILVTAFLISNTIKITIFSRKTEIGIMRLVGASNLNIKIPFILEGLFLGILGSIIPIIITSYGYMALFKNFNGQLFSPFIKLIDPSPFVYYVSGVLILIGIFVGMIGSWRAVRKHLKI